MKSGMFAWERKGWMLGKSNMGMGQGRVRGYIFVTRGRTSFIGGGAVA